MRLQKMGFGKQAALILSPLLLLFSSACIAPATGHSLRSPDVQLPSSPSPGLNADSPPFASGPFSPASVGFTTDPLVVDNTARKQIIDGLGVNANAHSWKNGQLKPAIDKYTALGPMVWRVIIEKADWESVQFGNPEIIDDAYYQGIYSSPKMQDLWNTIQYIEASRGQTVSLSVMGAVPEWMGGSIISPDKEEYWVRTIASLLDYGRRHEGLRLDLVSPLNEPDWNGAEGPRVDPHQMVSLLGKLSRRLDAMGMSDVRFVVPDTAGVVNAHDRYVPALLSDDEVSRKIARLGVHTYSGDAASVTDLVAKRPGSSANVWATEFNSQCQGCDDGSEQADTWDHAFDMGEDLMALIRQGVSGGQLYDAWDGYYEHHGAIGHWGALRYDASTGTYSERKSFAVLSIFLKSIPPGAARVVSEGAHAVNCGAFVDASTSGMSAVCMNPTGIVQHFPIRALGNQISRAQIFTSWARAPGPVAATPEVKNGEVVVTIPPGGVIGLTTSARPSGNLP